MTTTIFLLGCAVFAAGLHRLGRCDRGELEQAALLPFADDPPAARAMTAATSWAWYMTSFSALVIFQTSDKRIEIKGV